jgi:hypothetical protein
VEEISFLLICVNMVGPILGKGVELVSVVIHGLVKLLQLQELLQLATEQTHREMMTTEGGAELDPWNGCQKTRKNVNDCITGQDITLC